mmetsp:Transcript_15345/g.42442  ORF Transcript_15345/g.42442 Transcript_15345/m.42442 type:complete len:234 (+) Transcript_15345:158-859(+)
MVVIQHIDACVPLLQRNRIIVLVQQRRQQDLVGPPMRHDGHATVLLRRHEAFQRAARTLFDLPKRFATTGKRYRGILLHAIGMGAVPLHQVWIFRDVTAQLLAFEIAKIHLVESVQDAPLRIVVLPLMHGVGRGGGALEFGRRDDVHGDIVQFLGEALRLVLAVVIEGDVESAALHASLLVPVGFAVAQQEDACGGGRIERWQPVLDGGLFGSGRSCSRSRSRTCRCHGESGW